MRFLFANWKLYLSERESIALARSLRRPPPSVRLIVFPSELVLSRSATILKRSRIAFGSQNIAPDHQKAATGEVSGNDLAKLGCRYVIIGHSERRALGETDTVVRSKLRAAVRSRLLPVLCVGETKRMRITAARRVVRTQLTRDLKGWNGETLFLTYEPVWAISKAGKGAVCPPHHAFSMAAYIREYTARLIPSTRTILLYGGNARGSNITEYVDGKAFHGALVGHASTKRSELKNMVQAIS